MEGCPQPRLTTRRPHPGTLLSPPHSRLPSRRLQGQQVHQRNPRAPGKEESLGKPRDNQGDHTEVPGGQPLTPRATGQRVQLVSSLFIPTVPGARPQYRLGLKRQSQHQTWSRRSRDMELPEWLLKYLSDPCAEDTDG